eukprot:2880806-Amphidinium_carterae.1
MEALGRLSFEIGACLDSVQTLTLRKPQLGQTPTPPSSKKLLSHFLGIWGFGGLSGFSQLCNAECDWAFWQPPPQLSTLHRSHPASRTHTHTPLCTAMSHAHVGLFATRVNKYSLSCLTRAAQGLPLWAASTQPFRIFPLPRQRQGNVSARGRSIAF